MITNYSFIIIILSLNLAKWQCLFIPTQFAIDPNFSSLVNLNFNATIQKVANENNKNEFQF